jgi:hypothetical protein
VVLAAGGWFLSREAENGLDLLNQAEYTEIQDRLGSFPTAPAPAAVDRRIRAHTEVDSALYFFQVRDSSGAVIFRSTNLGPCRAAAPPLTEYRAGRANCRASGRFGSANFTTNRSLFRSPAL